MEYASGSESSRSGGRRAEPLHSPDPHNILDLFLVSPATWRSVVWVGCVIPAAGVQGWGDTGGVTNGVTSGVTGGVTDGVTGGCR